MQIICTAILIVSMGNNYIIVCNKYSKIEDNRADPDYGSYVCTSYFLFYFCQQDVYNLYVGTT